MACRTVKSAEKAQEYIMKSTGNMKVKLYLVDLSDQKEVERFVQKICNDYDALGSWGLFALSVS